jgi:hypothetical protein
MYGLQAGDRVSETGRPGFESQLNHHQSITSPLSFSVPSDLPAGIKAEPPPQIISTVFSPWLRPKEAQPCRSGQEAASFSTCTWFSFNISVCSHLWPEEPRLTLRAGRLQRGATECIRLALTLPPNHSPALSD